MADKGKVIGSMRKVFDIPEGQVQKGVGDDGEVKTKGKRGRKKRVSGEGGAENSPRKYKKRIKSEGGSQVEQFADDDLDMDDVEDD
jgi:hypothetical protein